MVHSNIVRSAIVKLGGVAVTERNQTPIEHVSSYLDMLAQSLKTEIKAAEVYGELMVMIEEAGDAELLDSIEQIYLAEVRSVEELRRLAE
jgi:bacterioferritin (cytochrome b1)